MLMQKVQHPQEIPRMQSSDEIKKARLRAMKLLERRDYTEAALRRKLINDGYLRETIDDAIEYVKSYGYIDDLRYALNYVRSSSAARSRRDIRVRLLDKGIEPGIIDEALDAEGAGEEEEDELIRRLILKKCSKPSLLDYTGRQKLYAYMYGKGFDTHRVERILNELALDITS